MPTTSLHHGDCLEVLAQMDSDSISAIVTDPPYGLSFMSKGWDYQVPSVEIWEQCLRVLKPGGHLLAFAGTRTQHRMCVNIEDAGFEIRDMIAWVYGSGFPKSLNVATAIAKLAEPKAEPNAEPKPEEVEFCKWLRDNSKFEVVAHVLGRRFWDCRVEIVNGATKENPVMVRRSLVPTAAKWQRFKEQHLGAIPLRIEELAKLEPQRAKTPGELMRPGKGNGTVGEGDWQGWGTALKPALEPITVARKPFTGPVAGNVLEHGTGAMNIDGCRVEAGSDYTELNVTQGGDHFSIGSDVKTRGTKFQPASGRWPANLIHDGSDEVTKLFPSPHGAGHRCSPGWKGKGETNTYGAYNGDNIGGARYGDSGSAARFFYTAKASKDDRDKGNTHPTVKPTDLMAYLCRLVTPPGGIVLDPFMGSGTTGKAALSEGFSFIGIERDPEYYAICESRFDGAQIGLALAV